MPGTPDLGFVACIEGGMLERQALLLFESIRLYTGRFRNCEIYALSPRVGHQISASTRKELDRLQVHYIDEILNTDCPEYGSANRVAAAAYIEDQRQHETLAILDSDTLFLREPSEFILSADTDIAIRSVDVKGISTDGPTDPLDAYWQNLCHSYGVDYDEIPWIESFVDHHSIKANYNGGLVVARSEIGIMRRWADFFFGFVRQGLRPRTTVNPFRAGAGWVEGAAGGWWGSNQAALSLATWSTTRRVQQLPPTYNYPLHLHERIDPVLKETIFPHLVHVHYHWLFEEDVLATNPIFEACGPLSIDQQNWLRSKTPFPLIFPQKMISNPSESKRMDFISANQHIVIITGMHRSGTSLVASIIQKAGVNIGDCLIEPDRGNPRGYFEDVHFTNFQEKLLCRFGQGYLVQDAAALGTITSEETEEALALIKQHSAHEIWGWKDPRTSLFLEFWQRLLPQAHYVFVYRHPVEVALSILQRSVDSDLQALANPLVALRAWQTYNQSILNFYAQHRDTCLLCYVSSIAANTHSFLELTARRFDLPLRTEGAQQLYHADELKQLILPADASSIVRWIAPEAVELYDRLEAQADLPGIKPSHAIQPSNSQLVELKDLALSLSQDNKLDDSAAANLFSLLLTKLDPQVVLAGKDALDKLRTDRIGYLETELNNRWAQIRKLEQEADRFKALAEEGQLIRNEFETIKTSLAYRFIARVVWPFSHRFVPAGFRQWLKRLLRKLNGNK